MLVALNQARQAAEKMRARPVVPHVSLPAVERANAAFAHRFRLVQNDAELAQFLRIRSASCASHAYVGMPEVVVSLAADLIGWMFLFDDRHGEPRPRDDLQSMMVRFASYEAVLLGGILPPNATPFHAALADLRDRAAWLGGPAWQRRWAANMARYFDGCILELPHRRLENPPGLAEYRRLRTWTVGTMACFNVSELGLARPLSEQESLDPQVQRATELAALLTAWVNDVYSQTKESAAGDPLNLVTVLCHERDLDLAQGFEAAVQLYNDDLRAFERVADEVRAGSCSQAVAAYLDALACWIYGNRAWTGTCGRYA